MDYLDGEGRPPRPVVAGGAGGGLPSAPRCGVRVGEAYCVGEDEGGVVLDHHLSVPAHT